MSTRAPTITDARSGSGACGAAIVLAGGRTLDLSSPIIMGVLNVTPDSFFDGGRHLHDPVAHARRLVEEGAAIVDVGGESTRPGAAPVDEQDELARVLPVVQALSRAFGSGGVPISIDTRRAGVARACLAAGAHLVNDVTGLGDPAMAGVVAAAGAALVLGHIQGTPGTMQQAPRYTDVVGEVAGFLAARRELALAAGVDPRAILVDPGVGFGKALAHNLQLLAALPRLARVAPVVVGLSRKSSLGALLGGRPPEERLAAGLGGAVFCALRGASIIRTHDVRPTLDAVTVALAIQAAGEDDARAA